MFGYEVAGARHPLVSRGARVRSNRNYQTLPSQRHHHHLDELTQLLKPAATTTRSAHYRRLTTHAVAVDLGADANGYGGRSSSHADNANRDRQCLYAVSDVDLTSCVDQRESATWKHPPSSTDLTSNANGPDPCAAVFGGLLRGGVSLQALPDTHL